MNPHVDTENSIRITDLIPLNHERLKWQSDMLCNMESPQPVLAVNRKALVWLRSHQFVEGTHTSSYTAATFKIRKGVDPTALDYVAPHYKRVYAPNANGCRVRQGLRPRDCRNN